MNVPTIDTTRELSRLVDYVRELIIRLVRVRNNKPLDVTHPLRRIERTLDAARTRLVQDGTNYLDAAQAFENAGRRALIGWDQHIFDLELQKDRHRARA